MGDQQERRLADYHWFCGVFDGEGCVSLVRNTQRDRIQFTPQIRFVSSSDEMTAEFIRILTEYGVPYHVGTSDRSHIGSKKTWRISINGMKRARQFLAVFVDGLRGKKAEALLTKEFIDRRLAKCCNQPYDKREYDIFIALRDLHGYRLTESSETLRRGLYERGKIKSDHRSKDGEAGRNDQPGTGHT
jgi:LAGLIDADG-like domain